MDSEVARYAVAWAEYRRALAGLISATDRLVSAAPEARARLRKGEREQRVELNGGGVVTVGLRSSGDIFVRNAT